MKPLFCCLLLLTRFVSVGQNSLPDFGIFTEEERKMKECSFDPEAEAIVLIDEASSDHDDEQHLITHYRVRIKVLKEKGIAYADVEIPYWHEDDFEYVTNIEAVVLHVDTATGEGTLEKIAPSQIFRKRLDEHRTAIRFAAPGVKVGSIIEYRYVSTKKHYGGLDDWYFQREIPTRISRYTLVVLPNLEFAYQVHKSAGLPIRVENEKGSGKVLFEMKNIAGLRDEPFMDSKRDYVQRVEFQLAGYRGRFGDKNKYMTTWTEVIRELNANAAFGRQLNKNLAGSGDIINEVKTMADPFHKMAAIYRYVQNNLTWDGYTGKFSESVKNAWEKKKGSNADINLILVNLLQEAGLEVYPILVSERGNGKVNANYPFIDQFNTVMAYIIIGDKHYVLDGASYYTPPFAIPFSVVNTTGFVVDRKKGGIVQLSENGRRNKSFINVIASIDKDGLVNGHGMVLSYDYARINRVRSYRRDKNKFADEYLVRNVPGLQVDSLVINNLDTDSLPIDQQFHFTMPSTSAGDYHLLTLNLFSGFEKNPFISNNRFTNIDYGCSQYVVLNQQVVIPADWQPETLPRDIKLIMPDTSISITRVLNYNKEEKKLVARYTIQTNRSVFTADEYPYVKEFYKKMTDILNEQVVLKQKATP